MPLRALQRAAAALGTLCGGLSGGGGAWGSGGPALI